MPDVDSLPHVADLADYLAPSRTALIVVDIQVDFASARGVLGGYGVDMTEAEVVVDRIEEMIAAARKAGVTVGFMRVMTRPETDSDALRTWMARRGTPGGEAICRIGSGGEAYYRVTPEPGDIEIEKLAYSSFHGTDLDAQLRARGIDTLVIAGISTDCCVDSTTRDAFHHNFHAFVVSDACTAYGDDLHYAALKAMSLHCALLTRTADVVAAWDKA
ncbi:isochorismatase hydrolase [Novosphingobium nitrogenifigens DSM 19370]|uniref:Isochorismatase hydrolase n=1 Tax=Novosphingobium nitrogenifigens DSM 19370 TaxID=983920 RepID=F1Z3J3_9SPHN|nr:isochorismatase family cysteine hydrolase [Novosphingobium nitrogenifigens]EGD60807.1 isochorismatase hydrolase [Novosphingobium nitrogenifigens DSM 19370]